MATDSKNRQTDPVDELEFDTGIDVKSLSAEEKAIYDKLNAQVRKAYLQKTGKLADERKAWEKEQGQLKAQFDEANQALGAWQKWYAEEGQYMTPREQAQAMKEEGLENPSALQNEISALRREFQQAATNYNKMVSDMQNELNTTRTALSLQTKLYDLRFRHPDADPMRILDTAKERNIQDMDLAYQLAYGDELRQKQVNEEVERRMTEEKAKIESEKAIVETTPSTTKYTPPAEAKSYGDASNNLLSSLRKSGTPQTIT